MEGVFRRHTVGRYEAAEAGSRSDRGCLMGFAGIANAPSSRPRQRRRFVWNRIALRRSTVPDSGLPRVVARVSRLGKGREHFRSVPSRQHEQLVVYLQLNRHNAACEMPTANVGSLASQCWECRSRSGNSFYSYGKRTTCFSKGQGCNR